MIKISFNVKIVEYESTGEVEYRLYEKPITLKSELDPDREVEKPLKIVCDPEIEKIYKAAHSLSESLRRTKSMIYSHGRANVWEWFITYTFNPKKIDSTDYDVVYSYLSKHLKNVRERKCPGMKYLVVPEYHSDGSKFHFHALMSNIDELDLVDSGKFIDGKTIYNIKNFKAGFSTAIRIGDGESARTSNYLSKYITKTLINHTKNRQRYLISKNLDKPVSDEFMLDSDELEKLRKELHEKTTSAKVVEVDSGSYTNRIEYINIKL